MAYPPRLAHLATRAVVIAKLVPTYAQAHSLDENEAGERLGLALKGALLPTLLEEAWAVMKGSTQRLNDDGLVEKVAKTLHDRPTRPGRLAEVTPGWSAFLVLADLEAGIASEAARKVMESPEGQRRARLGLAEVGQHLAKELTRGK